MKQKSNSLDKITTKEALIEFYMALRQYSLEINDTKKEESSLEYLSSMDELELIKYIKDSIDTVILTLAEKKINEFNNQITHKNIQEDYESMLVKYEQDIRGHIKVEHQLKLYSDSLQNNIEELEKEKKLGFNHDNNKKYIEEIQALKKEIKYQKKLITSYEEQNIKNAENEKKLKNVIAKNEKKYKNEIEALNKKIKSYIEKINIINKEKTEKTEKRKSETIFCNSSRRSNNTILMRNLIENEGINSKNHKMNNSLHGMGRLYRNSGNNISISDNHSTSMANTRPYVKLDKYILNKYVKNTHKEQYQYQNKIKNLKNVSNLRSTNIHNGINIPNNNNNSSYILDSKAQDEIINKFMLNDNSLINTKRIYNRHKSIENNSNNYIKAKNVNIKKLLMINNNSNKNSYKDINKGIYNRSLVNKKNMSNNSNNSINSDKYMNKTAKEININNIIENKNNIGCNFVNNINIYSNNMKQDNGNNNFYIANNVKKYAGNTSFRAINKNGNNLNATNYIHIHRNKNSMVTYRNKQKEGKMISSITSNAQKKY